MSTPQTAATLVNVDAQQFFIAPQVVAEVELQFSIGPHLFNLPCQVIERFAPEPRIELQYDGDNAPPITVEQMHALRGADGTLISTSINSDVATLLADVYAHVSPFFGMMPDMETASFVVARDKTSNSSAATIHEVSFSIINMHILSVTGHIVNGSKLFEDIGGAVLQDDDWTVQIRQSPQRDEAKQYLRSVGGFQITHIASIHKNDGTAFSIQGAREKIASIRLFLSFANGAYIGTCRTTGTDSPWTIVWEDWHGYPADWSNGQPSHSWLRTNSQFNRNETRAIADLFPLLISEVDANDDAVRTVERYLGANATRPFIDFTSSRTMGEMAAAVLQPECSNPWLRLALELSGAGVNLDIPPEFENLQKLYDDNPRWTNRGHSASIMGPGPTALRELRDHYEHPARKINGLNNDYAGLALYEAWHLGQWYLETLILHRCGYQGERANRIKSSEWGPFI